MLNAVKFMRYEPQNGNKKGDPKKVALWCL